MDQPVFVDSAIHRWRGALWCHVFCADLDRLHDFAGRIGLKRAWFQEPPAQSWPHYDTIAWRRDVALAAGALPATRRQTLLTSHAARVAWCRAHRPDLLEDALARQAAWHLKHPNSAGEPAGP